MEALEIEIWENGKGRKTPFVQPKKKDEYAERPRKSGVVKRKPDKDIGIEDVEGMLDSSILAKIR